MVIYMKLVKCHMAYLFNKNTLIILSIAIIIFGIALRENAMINSGTKSEIMNEYLSSCESLYRLLFTFISIFIFANSIYNPNDFYRYFILTKISRVKYLLSKIITNILIISGLSIFIYVNYLILGFIKKRLLLAKRRFDFTFIFNYNCDYLWFICFFLNATI